ncbi:MAG: hypothetical protein KKB70_04990, partial [Proteobacteria bacterium]|nr:hypothetical protein [Pseudomonadota bacterium]MBU1610903.1 hypothetical protein [Pseudomonadota bacterium]
QYVVVSWQNIPFLGWLSFYGTWDVEKGEGERHQAERVEDFKLDPRGALVFRGNRPPMPLSSVDMLDGGPYKHKDFANKGPHLVYNKTRQDAVLLDDVAYDSVMVQLLVGQPDQGLINKYFELVVEGTPHVRVYRVR